MIDFANIENYKENNRIEAKRALGGLPHSIWETYSAFANTLGGIILLGVEEHCDKTLHAINLPDPERLISEFWALVSNRKKVSTNILSDKDVSIEHVNGCRIVAIRVPRAHRTDKPIFIDGDVTCGTYRRGGEGDYRCTREEVFSMMRDSRVKTQDMSVLEELGLDALDTQSISRYRASIKDAHRSSLTENLDDIVFLKKAGAAVCAPDNIPHPTEAGLLMLGKDEEIRRLFPSFSLEYSEFSEGNIVYRISSSKDCENLYTFFCKVSHRLTGTSNEVFKCLREALANCLINADYHGDTGVVISVCEDEICFTNPGGFRVDIDSARAGGVSDPRNSGLAKMFGYVDACKGLGGGISGIYSVWKRLSLPVPEIYESFAPEKITLRLKLSRQSASGEAQARGTSAKDAIYKESIVLYLTDRIYASSHELASLLGISVHKTRSVLCAMIADGIITPEGSGKARKYRLKR